MSKGSTKYHRIECQTCHVSSPVANWVVDKDEITEAATLTCPVCKTKMTLSAEQTSPVKQEEPPENRELPSQEKTPPEDGGGPEAAVAPPPPSESITKTRCKLLGCSECGAEWLGMSGAVKCVECGSDLVIEVKDRTVVDRVSDMLTQVASGVPARDAVALLIGERINRVRLRPIGEQEKRPDWEGPLEDFSTKITALIADLGLDGDVGDVVGALKEGGALTMTDGTVSLKLSQAEKVLVKMAGESWKEPQAPQTPAPALAAPGMGISSPKSLGVMGLSNSGYGEVPDQGASQTNAFPAESEESNGSAENDDDDAVEKVRKALIKYF